MSQPERGDLAAVRPYDLAGAAHDLPAWEGPPRRSIVICSHPRSGSTLLAEAMAFAGGLGVPIEYFHRGFRPALERRWRTSGIDALGRAAHRHRTDSGGTFAAKLFWIDVDDIAQERDAARFSSLSGEPSGKLSDETYRALWAGVAPLFPNPVFIHLTRRDRIRQAVSALFAEQSGLWRSIPALGDDIAQQEPSYDADRIRRLIGLARFVDAHWTRLFAAIGARPDVIAYEDLDRDYAGAVAALLTRLGRPPDAARQRLRRQSDARTEAFVLRYLRETAPQVG